MLEEERDAGVKEEGYVQLFNIDPSWLRAVAWMRLLNPTGRLNTPNEWVRLYNGHNHAMTPPEARFNQSMSAKSLWRGNLQSLLEKVVKEMLEKNLDPENFKGHPEVMKQVKDWRFGTPIWK